MRPLVSPRRLVAVICYLGLPTALRGARHWSMGRPHRLRCVSLHRGWGWRGPPGGAVHGLPEGAQWRNRPTGQVGRARCRHRRSRPVSHPPWSRSSSCSRWRGPSAPCCSAHPMGVGVSSSSRPRPSAWRSSSASRGSWARRLAGKASVGIFGLPVAGATAPGWGEVVALRRRPGRPFAAGVVAHRRRGRPAGGLGRGTRLVWGSRLWVARAGLVGSGFCGLPGATWARSRRRRRSCWRPPRSLSPPVSASASPRSRTI